jgi:phytoene dehydrogenase-like protein
MARVVVVGAGVSGLAAAARLARLRHDVVVCERSPGPGGQAGRFERDGFAFDTGPTLVHMPAGMRDLFVKTGKTAPLETVLELRPAEPAVRWQFADGTLVDLPNATRAGTLQALSAALGPGAARGWDEFLAQGDEVWQQFRQGFLTGPVAPVTGGLLRPKEERRRLAALRPAKSLPDLIQRHIKDPRVRQAAAGYALRLGSDPRTAPAGAVIWPWLEHTFGAWEVIGGMRALVDAIADRAVLRGAQLRYDTEVVAVQREAGRVSGVRLADGEVLPADVVVAGVADTVLAGLLGDPAPTTPRSCAAVTLLLALRGEDAGPASTVSFPADADAELAGVFGAGPAGEPTLFLGRGSAPAGHSALTVTAMAAAGATVDPTVLLRTVVTRGYAPSDRLLWWEFIHTGASIAGPALVGRDGLLRPPNAQPTEGLFQVGASAHPGPGLTLAPLSAALVAETLGRARR